MRPAFEVAYAPIPGSPTLLPTKLLVYMRAPPPDPSIAGICARVARKAESRLVEITSDHPSALQSGTAYVFLYNGSSDNFRVLNASGFMDQTVYNRLYRVGSVQLLGVADSPNVPYGVTATWTLETADGLYLRATTTTPVVTGGSATTSSDGAHTHTMTTGAPSATRSDIALGVQTVPTLDHTHSGTTSSNGAHTHTITPPFVLYRVYRRTA